MHLRPRGHVITEIHVIEVTIDRGSDDDLGLNGSRMYPSDDKKVNVYGNERSCRTFSAQRGSDLTRRCRSDQGRRKRQLP